MRYQEIIAETARAGKIIAFHGTSTRIKQFQQPYLKPHYFTQDKDYAKGYVGAKTPRSVFEKPRKGRNYLLTVALDIQHMFDTQHDPGAVAYYNTQFLPTINRIHAKYKRPLVLPLAVGTLPSFVDSDELWRYFTSYPSPYDGMLVDEGFGPMPSIVPFQASQITILKAEIVKFPTSES